MVQNQEKVQSKNRGLPSSVARICAVVVAFIGMTAQAIVYTSQLPVKLGEWNTKFAEAKQLADAQSIPMVLFWGGAECSVCKNLEAAVETETFTEWQASRKLVMVFQSGTSGEMYDFVKNPTGNFPYLCVYWLRPDGTATTNRFSGTIKGALPWPATGASTVEHFINSVESFIGEYQPTANNSGDFIVGDEDGDRLEAVPDVTKSVRVPLVRTRASVPFAATNRIVVTLPRQLGVSTNEVVWAEGEETKYPEVVLPESENPEERLWKNEKIQLDLLDSQDQVVGTRNIWLIAEPKNSPKNPRWIGERTADTLEWGEWTMDIDVATNKAAAAEGDAWTLVGIVGSLWCPDCFKTDEHFLADPAVTNWAAANHVTFVAADIPNIPQTAPALLSYQTNYVRSTQAFTSGAGYLTRHQVDPDAAAACLARNYHFAQDLYHRPEDTNKNRTGVPIFVLLNKQGEMVGRFTRLANTSPTDSSHNMAYLARLSEMIQMAGDADEMGNNHVSTTSSTLAVPGGTFSGRISHADAIDTMKLGGVASGAEVTISATANNEARNVRVTLSVIEVVDGSSRTIASQKGNLDGLVVTAALEAVGAEWFVQLSASVTSTDASNVFSSEYAGAEGTVTPYTLNVVEMVLVPRETAMSNAAAAGEATVAVRLAEGETYRFDGLPQEGWEEALEVVDAGKKLYRARTTGDVALPVAEAGGTLVYQLWRPGEVAFGGGDLQLEEKAGLVEVAVVRTNGVSGAASVTVAADLSEMAAGRIAVGQCDEAGAFTPCEPTLTWAEGEDGERTFWLMVVDDEANDGDQEMVLTLEAGDGTTVAEGGGNKNVTVIEDDLPVPGRLAITSLDPAPAKDWTVYAAAGSAVAFTISRLGGAEGEAKAVLSVTVDGTAVEGDDIYDYLDAAELTWADKCRGEETVKTVILDVPEDAAGKKIAVAFTGSGAKADTSARRVTVVVYDLAGPRFSRQAVSHSIMKTLAFSTDIETIGLEGDTLKVTKVGGSLPNGLKATFSRGVLKVSGTPTRTGSFTVGYRVTAVRDGVSIPGQTVTLSFDVADPKSVSPALAAAFAKTRTFRDVQMVDAASKRLAGLLTLTVPASGRLSACYSCSEGKLRFTASGWEFEEDTSTFKALLRCAQNAYSKYWIEVFQRSDGQVDIEMYDSAFPLNLLVNSVRAEDAWSKASPANDWEGRYTVACPFVAYKAITDSDTAYYAHSTGAASFTLKLVAKSALNAGRVTYAGWLANGQSVSGTAVLTRDGDVARMPIYVRTAKDFFTTVCAIKKGAKAYWEENGSGESGFGQRVVEAPDDVEGWWTHTEKTDAATFSCRYGLYGSYWEPSADLGAILEQTGVQKTADFATDLAEMPESPSHGEVAADGIPAAEYAVSGQTMTSSGNVTLRLAASTGVVSGTFRARFAGGTVTVTVKGVALPGWTGCGCHGEAVDLPFVIGSGWFSDKVFYKEVDALRDRTLSVSLKRACEVSAKTRISE